MKLNRKNTKKRQRNNFPEVRRQQKYGNFNSKNFPSKQRAKMGRVGKPANKKRRVVKVVRRRRTLSWRTKALIFVLMGILIFLLWYARG